MDTKPPADNIAESNLIGMDLLINDAATALTLLDLAETTQNPLDRSRRIAEAHHAYAGILSFLPRLEPTEEQIVALKKDLAVLARRLRAAGIAVD